MLQCDAVLHLVMICPGLAARPTARTRNSLAATLLLLLRELIFGGDDNDDGAFGQAAYMEIYLSVIFLKFKLSTMKLFLLQAQACEACCQIGGQAPNAAAS